MSEQPEEHPAARRSAFYRGVLLTGSGTAINITLLFLETLLAVRWLPTEGYGIYVLLLAVVNLGIVVVDCGCKASVTQMIARGDPGRQAALANNALIFRLAAVAGLSVLIWLGSDLLSMVDPSRGLAQYVGYVPLLFAVASFDEILSAILQGFQVYRHMAIAQIGRSVLRLCLSAVLLGVYNLGVTALIYSWLISFAASAAYQYAVLPISRRVDYHRPLLGEMLRFGLPLQGTRLLWFTFSRINVLLLGALAGPASVAFYEVAARIPEALQRLYESYNTVYFPTVTALLSAGKRREAVWILNHSLRLISFAAALGALLVVLFGREITVILFSSKYADSSLAFAVLMIALHMTLIGTMMGYTLTSAGYPGRSLSQDFARTALNVVGDLVLIPLLGFVGPALATSAAAYTANPVALWLLRRSGVAVGVGPYAKQTLLLLSFAAFFWWAQPAELVLRVVMLILFILLNVALSTISLDDLSLILPRGILRRLVLSSELAPDGR